MLGFGNVLWKGVKEAVDADGFLGIFKGGFQASAVGIKMCIRDRLMLGGLFYLIEKAGGLKGFTHFMIAKRSVVKSRVGAEPVSYTHLLRISSVKELNI